MRHMCIVYGVAECESYATPTTIMQSVISPQGKTYSIVRRITKRSINLDKVAAVNELSRKLATNNFMPSELENKLMEIDERRHYCAWQALVAASVATGAFTGLFGGGLNEFLCGALIGLVLRLILQLLSQTRSGDFFINMAEGCAAMLLSELMCSMGWVPDRQILTISGLMLLVPGMLFTNALRDMAAGDLVSGVSRVIETICIAGALACGAVLAFTVLSMFKGH